MATNNNHTSEKLLTAINNQDIPSVQQLLKNSHFPCTLICMQDERQNTALHYAAALSDWGKAFMIIHTLLQHPLGVDDVFAQNVQGKTALHYAADMGHDLIVQRLISHLRLRVDPMTIPSYISMKDNMGQTPLHYAARKGYPWVIPHLLSVGAYIDAQDEMGATTLHYAAAAGNDVIVNMLLRAGANIHAQDQGSATPLHRAAATGNGATVDTLLRAGANIHAQDQDGATPLHRAAATGNAATVDTLLRAKANIHARDQVGATALHCAAVAGNGVIVGKLLNAGADIHVRNDYGATLLHYAVVSVNLQMLTALIDDYKLDTNLTDNYGNNALSYLDRESAYYNIIEAILSGSLRPPKIDEEEGDEISRYPIRNQSDRRSAQLNRIYSRETNSGSQLWQVAPNSFQACDGKTVLKAPKRSN